MFSNYKTTFNQFDPKVVKNLKKINEEIEEENKNDFPDKEKLLKLRQEQLIGGLHLTTNYYNNYRRNIPW